MSRRPRSCRRSQPRRWSHSERSRTTDLMTPGASLIISDLGMNHETGKGTDFIMLTR